MQDTLAFIDTFTVPTDAGPNDPRVVIGPENVIQIYDSTGDLRIQLGGPNPGDEDKILIYTGDPDSDEPAFLRGLSGTRPSLDIGGPETINQTDKAHIELSGPVNDPGLDRARIDFYGDDGNIDISFQAAKFRMDTGANAPVGEATLVGGTVTVNNTNVTATTLALLSRRVAGGTLGDLTYTRNAGVSFTINSTSGTDTSTISYFLIDTF